MTACCAAVAPLAEGANMGALLRFAMDSAVSEVMGAPSG